MKIQETELPGLKVIEPDVFGDSRGFFMESWNLRRFSEQGLDFNFVQDNVSLSRKGILRGLHFQNPGQQGKLVHVLRGEVFDVVADIRVGSPTFGRWFGIRLSSENHLQLYVPKGFAHGFCVLSDEALFVYKCTDFYNQDVEFSLRWNDPDLDIAWPVPEPSVSDKDEKGLLLKDLPQESLPRFDV